MAFDMPLEADQPGESGFFLSFVTSPVVGTLMWILGGESEQKLGAGKDNLSSAQKDEVPETNSNENEGQKQAKKRLARNIPDIVESDCSCTDEGECSFSAENWGSTPQVQQNTPAKKPNRKTSWSDHSGQDLVEYFDETSHHEPIGDAKPIKSVMKRSSTSRFNSNVGSYSDLKDTTSSNLVNNPLQHQFVPSGITGGVGGGLIMPSGGGMKSASGGGGNGHISPQWGWYISTTPPPLEKYSDTKQMKQGTKEKNKRNLSIEQHMSHLNYNARPPVPVFKKTLKGSGRTHMEWPSIPL